MSDAELRSAAVEWIHWEGAATIQDLVGVLRAEGWSCTRAHLRGIENEYEALVRQGNLFLSTDESSPLVAAFVRLGQMGVAGTDLLGGLRRGLRSGRLIHGLNRSTVASAALELFVASGVAEAELDLLADDDAVVSFLRDQPGGVASRRTTESAVERLAPQAGGRILTYSPLLELVASGVFGVRGDPIDVGAIEVVRPTGRSPWSSWGRLDRRRVWVQVKTEGESLRARIPNDCSEAIGVGTRALMSTTGARLGTLTFSSEGELSVRWDHRQPDGWRADGHAAVLEFDTAAELARLLPGTSPSSEEDPRFVDGLALHAGRWAAVTESIGALYGTKEVLLPRLTDGLSTMTTGDSRTFQSSIGDLAVRREPHAVHVRLPESFDGDRVGYLRFRFSDDRCRVDVLQPATTQFESVTRALGFVETTPMSWSAVAAALGLSVTDRRDVVRALADRERFDLAAAAQTMVFPARRRPAHVVAELELRDGHLSCIIGGQRRWAHAEAGDGALGLAWRPTPAVLADPEWAELTRLVAGVWDAAVDGDIELVRTADGWSTGSENLPSLERALRASANRSRQTRLHRSAVEVGVPLSAFGFQQLLSRADRRLVCLRISVDKWTSTDVHGDEHGNTPVRALAGDDH